MNIKEIRRLLREGHSVVLVEEGETPLVVTELAQPPRAEEVPIASRWPKVRTVMEPRSGAEIKDRQDQVLDRLNKEILALKAQIAQEEEATQEIS